MSDLHYHRGKVSKSLLYHLPNKPYPNHMYVFKIKVQDIFSDLLSGNMNPDSTIVTKDAKVRVLRSARLFSSQADTSRDIEYVFGNDYLTTYLNKGPFQVKSVVPRLPWDQPSFPKAQRRLDGISTGNKYHIYSY